MAFLRALACVALLALAGCMTGPGGEGGEPTPSSGTSSPASPDPSAPPEKGGFRVLETGQHSYAETDDFEGRVLRDQASWEAFWAEHRSGHGEPGEPPAVDFGSEVAIAVLLGERPSGGHSIEVADAAAEGGGLAVRYATTSPGSGCGTAAVVTHPFQLVAAKAATDAEVRFELAEERVREC